MIPNFNALKWHTLCIYEEGASDGNKLLLTARPRLVNHYVLHLFLPLLWSSVVVSTQGSSLFLSVGNLHTFPNCK